MPTVHNIGNRGTDDVPFGYVYVDDTRVGFHIELRDFPEPTPVVWGTRPEGRWPYPSPLQFDAAKSALVSAGIFKEGEIKER